MKTILGGCHCGNIELEAQFSKPLESYSPRVCDCGFCMKHGAAYVSDPQGTLRFVVRNQDDCRKYLQGSDLATFVLCARCGVLTGVLYRSSSQLFAALNARVIDRQIAFGAPQAVSPKKLSPEDKVNRWQALWFARVELSGSSV
jgi:hypothetical protein